MLVDELLQKLNASGVSIDRKGLQQVVDTNNKKRFAFSDDGAKIRASQGHSIEVNLDYRPTVPPTVLYHGTAEKNIAAILQQGLKKVSRQHVHLSTNRATAIQVGKRHGKPVVLEIESGRKHNEGYPFFLSANGVWLTETVPALFIRKD